MRRGKSRRKDLGQLPSSPFSTLLHAPFFFSSIHLASLLSTFSPFSLLFLPFFDLYSYRTTLRFLPFVFHRFLRSPRFAPFLSSTLFTLHFSFSLLSTRQILSFFFLFLPLLIKFHSNVRFLCSPASLFCCLLLCFSPISFRFSIPVHLFIGSVSFRQFSVFSRLRFPLFPTFSTSLVCLLLIFFLPLAVFFPFSQTVSIWSG